MKKTPSKDIFDFLSYNPDTGVFLWLDGAVRSGEVAGAMLTTGYRQIQFRRIFYYAHRLAFFFMNGDMPKDCVDHINGDRSDNRWANLRECSTKQNAQNVLLGRNNRLPGVSWQAGKYIAQIRADGVNHWLGRHHTEEEAHNAYVEAKRRLHTFNPELRAKKKAEREVK